MATTLSCVVILYYCGSNCLSFQLDLELLEIQGILCLCFQYLFQSLAHKKYMPNKYLQNRKLLTPNHQLIQLCLLICSAGPIFPLMLNNMVQWLKSRFLSSKSLGTVKFKSELSPVLSHVTLAKSVDLSPAICRILTVIELTAQNYCR